MPWTTYDDVEIGEAWIDLAAVQSEIVTEDTLISLSGTNLSSIRVAFGGASAPTEPKGIVMEQGDNLKISSGGIDHLWCQKITGDAVVSIQTKAA